jgi:hypothetical protein
MRMKTANNLLDEIHAVSGVTLSSRMVKKQLQFASLFLHSLGTLVVPTNVGCTGSRLSRSAL